MMTIIPNNTPIKNSKTKQVIGYVSNPDNAEAWSPVLKQPEPENAMHVQYNPIFEGGIISYVEQIIFGTEEAR